MNITAFRVKGISLGPIRDLGDGSFSRRIFIHESSGTIEISVYGESNEGLRFLCFEDETEACLSKPSAEREAA